MFPPSNLKLLTAIIVNCYALYITHKKGEHEVQFKYNKINN